MANCHLCKNFFEEILPLKGPEQVEAYNFMSSEAIGNGDSVGVCKTCSQKIEIIVGIKQSSKPSEAQLQPSPASKTEPSPTKQKEVANENIDEEEDVDLEELDQLSSYYAELEDDPEYIPNASKKAKTKVKSSFKKLNKVALKCQVCEITFSRVIALRRHFLSEHEDTRTKWECEHCDDKVDFLTAKDFITHFIKVHVAIHQCKKCGKKFRLARTLRNHFTNYCPQVSGHQKPCDVCDKLMPQNMLASHRAFSHICPTPNCNQILPNRREKCKHLREVHKLTKSLKLSKQTHNCKVCLQTFETSYLLGEHLVSKHSDDTDLVISCPKIGCKFKCPKGSIKLRSHLEKFHNNESAEKIYKFECKICFGRFKSADVLKAHTLTKHDPNHGRVTCPYCPYSLPTKRKSDLYRHHFRVSHPELTAEIVKQHDEKLASWKADLLLRAKIQCLMCSFAGVKTSNMVRHYKDVHGYDASIADKSLDDEMPDGCLCTECGEIFINRHGLMRHLIKAHSKPGGEPCLYCPFRYSDLLNHIDSVHAEEKNSADRQVCQKCVPAQKFNDFNELLRHTRSYHRKKPSQIEANRKSTKVKKLCDNCGKFVKHKSSECPKLQNTNEDGNDVADEGLEPGPKKKYVPIHLSGTCPYCGYKFSDLLGHIRHGHESEKCGDKATTCPLCNESFGSVRELVTHRQLHPQFKCHACSKCSLEFETIVELRHHRSKLCTKRKAKKVTKASDSAKTENHSANADGQAVTPALATLMMMANHLENSSKDDAGPSPTKSKAAVDFEGRGTVSCHLCKTVPKSFVLKTLLKQHYIRSHGYDPRQKDNPNKIDTGANETKEKCHECNSEFDNIHLAISHHLENHAVISGHICPYCDSKYGAKKFVDIDRHVQQFHVIEMQNPIQTCTTCKTNFTNYESLKVHRQIHEGGNRPRVLVDVTSGEELSTISVHPRVGAKPEISNRGGLKCQLCNAFKIRKDHLKLHYVRYHGFDPKACKKIPTTISKPETFDESSMQGVPELENSENCPKCHLVFENTHYLIKHLLKDHCSYSGTICPYCSGHFPSRFIDLQSHVTSHHMDQLMGYNICNKCKVCRKQFSGYAELRDHVQLHGDGYRDPLTSHQDQGSHKKSLRKSRQDAKSKPQQLTPSATITTTSNSSMASNSNLLARRTKILVPVSKDSTTGQLKLSADTLQRAILEVAGGQVENLPGEGLIINNGSTNELVMEDDQDSPLAGIIQESVWN